MTKNERSELSSLEKKEQANELTSREKIRVAMLRNIRDESMAPKNP